MDQKIALQQIFEKLWEYAIEVNALHIIAFLETSFEGCSYSMALTASYQLVLGRCTNVQYVYVYVSLYNICIPRSMFVSTA